MTDWYFEIAMNKLDKALTPFLEHKMTLKQWDAFHKKLHYTMNETPQPQEFNQEERK